jgi:electron transport complex protein RnfD
MGEVLLATLPLIVAAAWSFGLAALLVVVATVAGATLTERLFTPASSHFGSLLDGSGPLTGVLLALTLPPSIPLWMAFLGGAIAIALGKVIWGGLGANLFNPALVGRAFLQAAFPGALTTWQPPGGGFFALPSGTFAAPLMKATDVVTTATPLALSKFDNEVTGLGALLLGDRAGCLGETNGLLLLIVGLILALRRAFDWRLPLSTLVAVAALSGVLHLWRPETLPSPGFMLLAGGLLFGAIFMVTDPVTTPITPRGAWIFGLGVGLLVVLIRLFGGLAEGVMYAILLMNAATPLINRWTQPKVFGG